MRKGSIALLSIGTAALFATTFSGLHAQSTNYATDPKSVAGANGSSGADLGLAFFATTDANTDNSVSRAELRATLEKFLTDAGGGSVSAEQLQGAIKFIQPRLPQDAHVKLMEAALPTTPAAKALRPRKLLIMDMCGGFIHTPIPLTNKMLQEYGDKNKLWATTVSWNPADINADNLKQYDAIVLNSTTGKWLDDPKDPAVTEARHKALLDFVRGGKGLVGIHGTGDSYHQADPALAAARAAEDGKNGTATGRRGGGAGGNRAAGPAAAIATGVVTQGDKNADQKVDRAEIDAVADAWFDKLDTDKKGAVGQTEFLARIGAVVNPNAAPRGGGRGAAPNADPMAGMNMGTPATAPGAKQDMRIDLQRSLWPDYSKMIGGFFKFHFPDTLVTFKLDDPTSPLNAAYKGIPAQQFYGEVYTFGMDTFSRKNMHVLVSVDYAKVSAEDKAKEPNPRADHDYALVWNRREGQGRVFYFALGNEERVFFYKPFNEQLLAGIQYALGDLKADDTNGK